MPRDARPLIERFLLALSRTLPALSPQPAVLSIRGLLYLTARLLFGSAALILDPLQSIEVRLLRALSLLKSLLLGSPPLFVDAPPLRLLLQQPLERFSLGLAAALLLFEALHAATALFFVDPAPLLLLLRLLRLRLELCSVLPPLLLCRTGAAKPGLLGLSPLH